MIFFVCSHVYRRPSEFRIMSTSSTTFTSAQQTGLLFKKLMGKPSTNENSAFYAEPNRPSRPAVFQSQFYSQEVPAVAPSDIATATTDDLGAVLDGSVVGKTSTLFPQIRKYSKVALTEVVGSNGAAYECALDATYGRVMQDSIPFNFDDSGSYMVSVYKSSGAEIPYGSGQFVLDCEAGILTFYTLSTITGVSAAQPPSISFYRYVGAKGAATSEQTVEQISGQAITFTAPETFNGGVTSTTGDDLAAIVVDDRNMANISSSAPAMALQFGSDEDGSWRLCVYGGGGNATATSLQFETRVNGVWVSKSSMFPV
jgi:hypothetical protein